MSAITESPRPAAGGAIRRLDRWMAIWLAIGVFAVVCFALRKQMPWLIDLPKEWLLPLDQWMNVAMRTVVDAVRDPFRWFGVMMGYPMTWLRDFLVWMPWPATVTVVTLLAYRANGWKLALFAALTMLYMVGVGYWEESMVTLSLVAIAVPISAVSGLLLGIWAAHSARVRRIMEPVLDVMQTVPTFAYLTPLILFLGYGPQVGLIASAIFAIPPMVRNVMVAVGSVAPNVVEAGDMSGCSRKQLTWWVEVPAAMPGIMMGLNQCVMAALSMVIIAAIIGGFADIGWEVLSTLRKAEFGPSLLSGIVIALMAMLIDRIGRGLSARAGETKLPPVGPFWLRHPYLTASIAAILLFIAIGMVVPPLHHFPNEWRVYPAQPLNDMVSYISVNWFEVLDEVKNSTLFFYLLPLRIGLENSVRANFWGFDMSMTVTAVYLTVLFVIGAFCYRTWGWRSLVGVVIFGGIYYFGTTGTPWPVTILVVTVLAYGVGGRKLGLFAMLSLLFMLIGGAWVPAMWSIYLMMGSVTLAFILGSLLGALASASSRFSAVMAPINDTLQTMPQFVYLIPIIMLFKIGDFSAMLAIIAYAIVPAIRYMEQGLRTVPAHVIEAAQSMGLTPTQIFWQVKLPLAMPQVMLGLNQTIMLGITMLVIAALVGTRDLGQMVFGSMTSANFGMGVIAGGSIALMAMVSDRIFQAVSRKQQKKLGLG